MRRFFTVTSPSNALAVGIYCMFAFWGVSFLFKTPSGPVGALGSVWSTALLIASSAAALATLTAPKRRDPDQSLIIELCASTTLCILLGWLMGSLWWYYQNTGVWALNLLGLASIPFVAFGARAIQIWRDRKDLRKFRASHPSS